MNEEYVKDAVRIRDEMRCTHCGMTDPEHKLLFGRGLHVHRLSPGSRYTVDGCITLCHDCHVVATRAYFYANRPVRRKLISTSITDSDFSQIKTIAKRLGMKPGGLYYLAIKSYLLTDGREIIANGH